MITTNHAGTSFASGLLLQACGVRKAWRTTMKLEKDVRLMLAHLSLGGAMPGRGAAAGL